MLRGREEECLMTLANLRDAEPESLLIQSEYMALQAEQLVQEDEKHERYGPGKSEFYYAIRDYKRLTAHGVPQSTDCFWELPRRLFSNGQVSMRSSSECLFARVSAGFSATDGLYLAIVTRLPSSGPSVCLIV
jgi:hypothetical protein